MARFHLDQLVKVKPCHAFAMGKIENRAGLEYDGVVKTS